MSRNLKLRTLLGIIAIPPIVLLGLIAAYGVVTTLGASGSAAAVRQDIQILSMVAVAGMIASALMVFIIGRRIMLPINEISEVATELADVRLPLLIQSLSTPGAEAPEFEPLEVQGNTELAELGRALNSLQERAVTVAAEQQRVVKEGISELVVNLARRNQSLLDRQIDTIDELESNEENPDRMERLFKLDHLATRMRRNAESLLVLAGAEPSRRRGGPVILSDVIRVAMSEIEDYQHVNLGEVTPAHIGAQGAVDLAHLMSEILENATHFSPPDRPVEVLGSFTAEGPYAIQVIDHGIGMSAEQLVAANTTLQNPPELGLALTRSLGFQVIGRLARRIGVATELRHTEGGGTQAIVWIPADVLSAGAAPTAVPEAFRQPAQRPEAAPAQAAPQAHAAQAPPTAAQAAQTAADPFSAAQPAVDFDVPTAQQQPAQRQPVQEQFAPQEEPAWEQPVAPQQQATQDQFAAQEEEAPFDWTAPAQQDAPPTQHEAPPAQQDAPPAQHDLPVVRPEGFAATPTAEPQVAPSFQPEQQPAPEASPPPSFAPPAQAPTGFSQPDPIQPAPKADFGTAASADQTPPIFPAPQEQPVEAQTGEPQQPGWQTPAVPAGLSTPAQQLEQAIPTGASFDSGVDALLDDPATRTNTGLVRRDRSQSMAPPSEGRVIGEPASAASVRSPDEIRSMLAQYREGLKGRPGGDPGNPIEEQPR